MAVDNLRTIRGGHVFTVGNLYKCLRGLKNRNGVLFKDEAGAQPVAVHGKIHRISDKGNVELTDNRWLNWAFPDLGPGAQIKMKDRTELMSLSRGDVITVSACVVDLYPGYSLIAMEDGVLHQLDH